MKGSTKGKGKGKKGKPRTAMGPCFICGSMGHGYLQCPDRFSARGGSPKGSKGKGKFMSKGKMKGKAKFPPRQVNYAGDYFVDIEQYQEMADDNTLKFVNVMSLENDNASACLNALKVIIDTGATESVCGVTSMARMIDSFHTPEYHVVLHDRPTFKFGNGHTQQATSRLDIMTKALKRVSFYLLDGQAEMTPPLLGGRELWNRNAVVAYCGEYFAHQAANGAWWTNRLIRLRGRHVAIDLDEEPSSLGSLINDLQRPISPDDDDDEDGGEDGPSSGNRRPRRRDPGQEHQIHDAVRRAANRANGFAPPDNAPADALPAETREGDDAAGDGGGNGGAAGANDALQRDQDEVEAAGALPFDDDVIMTGHLGDKDATDTESIEVIPKTPAEVPSGFSADDGRHKQMKRELEPDDSPSDRNSKSKSSVAAPVSSSSQSNEPNHKEYHDDDVLETDHDKDRRGDGNSDGSQGHDGGTGSILMLSTVFGAGIGSSHDAASQHDSAEQHGADATLKSLAQRLQKLKEELNGSAQNRRDTSRSPSRRMAMSRSPCERQGEEQPVCAMDKLQAVRASPELCGEDQRTRGNTVSWTGTGACGDGAGRVAADLPAGGNEREDLHGQGHGVEGPKPGDESWTRKSAVGNSCRPTSWQSTSGRRDHDWDYGLSSQIPKYDKGTNTTNGTGDTNQVDKGNKKCVSNTKLCGFGSVGHCCSKGQGKSCSCPEPAGDGSSRGAPSDGDPFGRREPDSSGRIAGLWNALKALREKMRPSGSSGNRLEADRHMDATNPKDVNHVNIQTTCTTSTTASKDTTKEDILSMKNSFTREILPPLAKKLAKAATLSAMVMGPVKEIFAATENKYDLVEIACSPTSTLTSAFED